MRALTDYRQGGFEMPISIRNPQSGFRALDRVTGFVDHGKALERAEILSGLCAALPAVPTQLPDIPDSPEGKVQHAWPINVPDILERLRLTIAKVLCIIDYSKART